MSKLKKGNRLYVQHRYEDALDAFLAHARECPAEATKAYASAAKACLHINTLPSPMQVEPGVQLVFQGNRKTARALFEKALSLDSNHFESLIGIAELLPQKSEERLEVMERAVRIQPDYLTLIEIGDFHRSVRSDFERAYDSYKAAMERSPRDRTAYQRLAAICDKLGRTAEAKDWKSRWAEVYGSKAKVGPAAGERRTT